MSFPWYKREPKKFIRGVVGLGAARIGCYNVIVDLIYEDEGSCLNDPHWIGGILGESSRQTAALIQQLVDRGKLVLEPPAPGQRYGRLFNAKASEVLEKQGTKSPRGSAESPASLPRAQREPAKKQGGSGEAPAPAPSENNGLGDTDKIRKDKTRKDKKNSGAKAPVGAIAPASSEPGSSVAVVEGEVETDLQLAFRAYNEAAALCPHKPNQHQNSGWAAATWPLTSTREKAVRARLAAVGLDGWRKAMVRAAASNFLSGRAKRQPGRERWGVDIGWLAKAENFAKLLEGKYDNDRGSGARTVGQDSARAGLMTFLGEEGKSGG